MTNYHQPPPYGPSYNSNAHVAPPTRHPPMPPYPYGQQMQTPYMSGRVQPGGVPPVQNANAYAYGANTPVFGAGGGASGPPFAGFGGQALPPPPFPPVPIPPRSSSPYALHPSSQPLVGSSTALFHVGLPADTSHVHYAAQNLASYSEKPNHIPTSIPDLEDGELSSGEPTLQQGIPSTSMSTGSVPPEPTFSTHYGIAKKPSMPLSDQTSIDTSKGLAKSANGIARGAEESLTSMESSRERIHAILRQLKSWDIGLADISNEGYDPNMLRTMYAETGVHSPPLKQMQPPVNATSASKVKPTKAINRNPNQHEIIQHSQDPSKTSGIKDDSSSHSIQPGQTISKFDNLKLPKPNDVDVKSVKSPTNTAKSKITKPLGGNQSGKPNTKSADTQPDRKGYIARLLQAKTGKVAPSNIGGSALSKAALPIKLSDVTRASSPPTVAQINPTPAVQGEARSILKSPSQRQKEHSDLEAKKKAQTELARQKIEALNNQKSSKQNHQTADLQELTNESQPPADKTASVLGFGSTTTTPNSRIKHLPHQNSYSSSNTQTPAFNIPGLFMTPESSNSRVDTEPSTTNASTRLLELEAEKLSEQGPQSTKPNLTDSTHQPITSTSISLQINSLINSAVPEPTSGNGTIATNPRKRNKASDFIDSPPTRMKRPLGPIEDASVIIDISEDEASEGSETDFDMKIDGDEVTTPKAQRSPNRPDAQQRSTKDFLPLSDFPSRKKLGQDAALMTPPVVQGSTRSQDPKDLQTKQLEIELMNRKIAELEQRIKSKQAASRTQSPGVSISNRALSDSAGSVQGVGDLSNTPKEAVESSAVSGGQAEARQAFNEPGELEPATEEQLLVEKRKEEHRLAVAEGEHSLATETSQESEQAQPGLQDIVKFQREGATQVTQAEQNRLRDEEEQRAQQQEESRLNEIEQHHLQEGEAQKNREEAARQKEAETARLREEETARLKQEEIIRAEGKQTSRLREEQDQQLQEEKRQRLQEAENQRLSEQQRRTELDEQRRLRKVEIESGLPILDAEVERTEQKLHSLRTQTSDLDKKLQEGIEGRRLLTEELVSLSQQMEAAQNVVEDDTPNAFSESAQQLDTEDISVITNSQFLEQIDIPGQPHTAENAAELEVHLKPSATPPAEFRDQPTPDEEVEEDVMDISRSEMDEGEISEYSPESLGKPKNDSNADEDEETYEPPSDIGPPQQSASKATDARAQPQTQIEEPKASNSDPKLPMADRADRAAPSDPQSTNKMIIETETLVKVPAIHRSPSFPESSDSEDHDYEPPEPAPRAPEVGLPPDTSSVASESHLSPPDVDTYNYDAPLGLLTLPSIEDPIKTDDTLFGGIAQESKLQAGHYVPYESPLKLFKSYRYHPEYLREISNTGFRSLTYSHDINPDNPVCRYELGGVCNDDSCDAQHFKKMALSDDKIIMHLGQAPYGVSGEEQSAYSNGLQQIILDLRQRKVKDFETVAKEIAAYRQKFLLGNSKAVLL